MEIWCWAVMRGSLTFPLGRKMIDLFSSYSRLVWNKQRKQWFEQAKSTWIYTANDLWDCIMYFSLSLSYTGVHVSLFSTCPACQTPERWVWTHCWRTGPTGMREGLFPWWDTGRGIVTVKTQTWNPYLPSAATFCLIKLPVNKLACRNH